METASRLSDIPVPPERVILLNTIPLTKARFEAEKKDHFVKFWHRRSDFLNTQFPAAMGWELYQSAIVLPVLAELYAISKNARSVIDYDVGFNEFRKAAGGGQFDVIFLVAHHIEPADAIEFAGRDIPLSEMAAFLSKQLPGKRKLDINFIICTGSGLVAVKQDPLPVAGIISTGFWYFPVIESYQFISHWILQFDGKKTMAEAYALAIDSYKPNNNS